MFSNEFFLIDSIIPEICFQLIDPSKQIKIEELLLIMKWEDFLIHVHNNTLNMFIKNIYIKYTGVKIILAIIGLQKYYQ